MKRRSDPESERLALKALDAHLESLNRHDWEANAETLNFPHVRIAGGRVRLWASAEEYALANPNRIRGTFENSWDHSAWDRREVVHSAPGKVHFDVQFTRYRADGRPLASYTSLWVVTSQDGHWGVQARSSFAP